MPAKGAVKVVVFMEFFALLLQKSELVCSLVVETDTNRVKCDVDAWLEVRASLSPEFHGSAVFGAEALGDCAVGDWVDAGSVWYKPRDLGNGIVER